MPYSTRLSYLSLGAFITEVRRLKILEPSEETAQLLEQEQAFVQWRKERDEATLQATEKELAEISPEALAQVRAFHEALRAVLEREGAEEARQQLEALCERIEWVREHIVRAFVLRTASQLQSETEKIFPGHSWDDIGIDPDDSLSIESRLFPQSADVEHYEKLQARKSNIIRALAEDTNLRLEVLCA